MYKKIISLLLGISLCSSICFTVKAQETDYDGYLYFTVERLTLGQGLIQEPVKTGYYNNENLAQIIIRMFGDKNTYKGDISKYNLDKVLDGGEPHGWSVDNIPSDVLNALGGKDKLDEREKSDSLATYDYTYYSGWMITVDNVSLNAGAGNIYLGSSASDGMHFKNGSTVRIQFSIYGWGEDIGISYGFFKFDTTNEFADKTEIISLIAEINNAGLAGEYGDAYINAKRIINKWNPTADEIKKAVAELKSIKTRIYKNVLNSKLNINVFTLNSSKIYVAFYNNDSTLNIIEAYDTQLGSNTLSTNTVSNSEYKIFVWDNHLSPIAR